MRAAAALLQPGGRLVEAGIDGNRHSEDELWTIQRDLTDRVRPIPPPRPEEIIEIGGNDPDSP